MPCAYIIVDTLITNDEEMEHYKQLAKPLVESFGGEYLARGGAVGDERKPVVVAYTFGTVVFSFHGTGANVL
jgi:uncharacterized protein (DUF1330 family)